MNSGVFDTRLVMYETQASLCSVQDQTYECREVGNKNMTLLRAFPPNVQRLSSIVNVVGVGFGPFGP